MSLKCLNYIGLIFVSEDRVLIFEELFLLLPFFLLLVYINCKHKLVPL